MKNPSKEIFKKEKIPKSVVWVCEELEKKDFYSYLVGGCVRDLIMGRVPNDYDVTTNATPEDIIVIFGKENTVYENKFGTVGVKIRSNKDKKENGEFVAEEIIEVTTFRKEGKYIDFRRPSTVKWGETIETDLMRRDFTINGMAYDCLKDILIDPYNGQKDIKDKMINCIGNPEERFGEDALRMLRALRFSAQLEFVIRDETTAAIFKLSKNLEMISQERIRDEFVKILMTNDPMMSFILAQKLGVLKYIVPEMEKGIGVEQNQAHKYDVYEHNLRTMQHAVDKGWPLHIRLAGLFHDISKPETRRWNKEKNDWTFYGHDVVGAKVAKEIMTRLKFEKEIIETVVIMVRWHMFFSDTEKITLSAVRRLVSNVGEHRVWDLMDLRACDRIGTGRPKENPYRFRVYKSMVAEALTQPVSLKMLKINGEKIMFLINEKPSPKIGIILNALFSEILNESEKNTEEYLQERTLEFSKMTESEIKKLSEDGKEKMKDENIKKIIEIKQHFHVNN